MTKSIHVCISRSSGYVIIDRPGSTRETCCEVTDVPPDVGAATVITKMNQLVFWPWPKRIPWPDIAGMTAGSLIRREQ